MTLRKLKNHPKSCILMAVGRVIFSAAPTAQNSPELHFRFINSFIQSPLLRFLLTTFFWNYKCMICSSEQVTYLSKFILWCLDIKITPQIHSDWKCDNCPEMVNAITMTTLIATCQEEANEFNDTKIELVAEKMNNWSNVLHKNHFLIGMLRKRLFDLYRLYPAPETEVELRPFLQVRMHKSW